MIVVKPTCCCFCIAPLEPGDEARMILADSVKGRMPALRYAGPLRRMACVECAAGDPRSPLYLRRLLAKDAA